MRVGSFSLKAQGSHGLEALRLVSSATGSGREENRWAENPEETGAPQPPQLDQSLAARCLSTLYS